VGGGVRGRAGRGGEGGGGEREVVVGRKRKGRKR